MVRKLLLQGMLVGLVAGALAFCVGKVAGEPQIDKAIAFEELVAQAHHEPEEADVVSRSVQSTVGLGAGVIVYGVAFGGLFALVFALAYGRLGPMTARGTAAALGLLGFVTIYLVPILKYPANPPSVGDHDTIQRRTVLYLLLIVVSVVAAVAAVVVRQRLRGVLGDWYATVAVGVGYVLVMLIAYVAMPGINEVPQQALAGITGAVTDAGVTFPPVVLWRFRIASLGVQLVTWSTIAIGFGYLATRTLESGTALKPDPSSVST
jgi:heme/copper-type cytochrome/quinol oxidase subunit 3